MTLPSQIIKEKGDLARELGKLKEHPSWEFLRVEVSRKRSEYLAGLLRKLMREGVNADPIDQREIDYQRGFWAGAKWVTDNPDLAESALAAALKKVDR